AATGGRIYSFSARDSSPPDSLAPTVSSTSGSAVLSPSVAESVAPAGSSACPAGSPGIAGSPVAGSPVAGSPATTGSPAAPVVAAAPRRHLAPLNTATNNNAASTSVVPLATGT